MSHKKLATLFIVTSLLTFATYTADAQDGPLAIITEGLVSYWTFDEVKKSPKGSDIIEDIVGDNDGVLQRKQKTVEGKYGNALKFDGLQDFVKAGTKDIPLGNIPITISVWFRKDEVGLGDQYFTIFTYGDLQPQPKGGGYWFSLENGKRRKNNVLSFSQAARGHPSHLKGPGKGISDRIGQWIHVTAIYNGAKRSILYVDGVEVAAKDTPEADVQLLPGEGVWIGATVGGIGFWLGLLDEMGIYNRALTPEEVKHNATVQQIFAVEPSGKLSLTWGRIKASR